MLLAVVSHESSALETPFRRAVGSLLPCHEFVHGRSVEGKTAVPHLNFQFARITRVLIVLPVVWVKTVLGKGVRGFGGGRMQTAVKSALR